MRTLSEKAADGLAPVPCNKRFPAVKGYQSHLKKLPSTTGLLRPRPRSPSCGGTFEGKAWTGENRRRLVIHHFMTGEPFGQALTHRFALADSWVGVKRLCHGCEVNLAEVAMIVLQAHHQTLVNAFIVFRCTDFFCRSVGSINTICRIST